MDRGVAKIRIIFLISYLLVSEYNICIDPSVQDPDPEVS